MRNQQYKDEEREQYYTTRTQELKDKARTIWNILGSSTIVEKQADLIEQLTPDDQVDLPMILKVLETEDAKHPISFFPKTPEEKWWFSRAQGSFYARSAFIRKSEQYRYMTIVSAMKENSITGDKVSMFINPRPDIRRSDITWVDETVERKEKLVENIQDSIKVLQEVVNKTGTEREQEHRQTVQERKKKRTPV